MCKQKLPNISLYAVFATISPSGLRFEQSREPEKILCNLVYLRMIITFLTVVITLKEEIQMMKRGRKKPRMKRKIL